MVGHIRTQIIEPIWQKDLRELDGEALRKEAHRRLQNSAAKAEHNCSDLVDDVATVQRDELWKKLSPTWEDFCLGYFERPAEFIDTVVIGLRALRKNGYDGPVTSTEASTAAAAYARIQAETVKVGGDRKSAAYRERINSGNATNDRMDRNDKPGILRRLARKGREDLLGQFERGEITANQAALISGLRKPVKSIPIDSPASAIRALLRVFSREELLNALSESAPSDSTTNDL